MLRRDEEGVASTVATVFSFLIILLFLVAVFKIEEARQGEREWSLLHDAESAFKTLRSAHDVQFSAILAQQHAPDTGPEASASVVIPVGIPAASPFMPYVPGHLACDSVPGIASVGFSYRAGLGVLDAVESSYGRLSLILENQKIPRARLAWENGALLLAQGDSAVVLDYPYFRIEPVSDGIRVKYRVVRIVDDTWSFDGTGMEILNLRTIAADSSTLDVVGRGEANLDDVREFVRALKEEIHTVSHDGSDRLTGSYATPPGDPDGGILNSGLKEQLVYYDNAQLKQLAADCAGASNDMNASARQLFQNVMDKILLGIDEGYIDRDYGLDLHARMGALLRCLDEMSASLEETCEFVCRSLFGGGGGRLEFLLVSEQRAAWGRWFEDYLSSLGLDADTWDVIDRRTFILVQIDGVKQITFQEAHVTFR